LLQVRAQRAGFVEQLLGPVTAHPLLENLQVFGILAHVRDRHLVGAEGALDRLAIDLLGAGPALGGAQDDHRPPGRSVLPFTRASC